MTVSSLPEHGGRLERAIREWGIPRHQWLDLSTGLNPQSWPIPAIPDSVWQRLPEADDGLPEIIRDWCGAPEAAHCLPVAGSQAAIQTLPYLRPPCRVGIPVPGYREHGYWWQRAGHDLVPIPLEQIADNDDWLGTLEGLVWINPNNPVGLTLPAEQLRGWHRRLQARGGFLVVDEAFVDPLRDSSIAPYAGAHGLVVLRSLGKFFGLAGIRAGAVLSDELTILALAERLGPWAMSGPARYIMSRALADRHWQRVTGQKLASASARLHGLLAACGLGDSRGTRLFRYLPHPDARRIHRLLASRGVLVRLFDTPPALRFGLPGREPEWQRLAAALVECH